MSLLQNKECWAAWLAVYGPLLDKKEVETFLIITELGKNLMIQTNDRV